MKHRGTIAAAAVLLLAACSSGSDSPDPEPTTATSASTEAEAEEDAATEQWASEIAKLRTSYDDAQASWDDATCSAMAVPDAVDCSTMLITMSLVSDTAQITLDGLQNEDGPTYLGDPPAEVASLLADTTSAATDASEAGAAVSCPGDECLSTAFEFERAWDALGEQYAGWDPYL